MDLRQLAGLRPTPPAASSSAGLATPTQFQLFATQPFALRYVVWIPVSVQMPPCSAVINSLIFFDLARAIASHRPAFAAVRDHGPTASVARLPVNFPVSREFGGGDRFALDWVHSHPPRLPGRLGDRPREFAVQIGHLADCRDTRDGALSVSLRILAGSLWDAQMVVSLSLCACAGALSAEERKPSAGAARTHRKGPEKRKATPAPLRTWIGRKRQKTSSCWSQSRGMPRRSCAISPPLNRRRPWSRSRVRRGARKARGRTFCTCPCVTRAFDAIC